jgi:hypothetical protein
MYCSDWASHMVDVIWTTREGYMLCPLLFAVGNIYIQILEGFNLDRKMIGHRQGAKGLLSA